MHYSDQQLQTPAIVTKPNKNNAVASNERDPTSSGENVFDWDDRRIFKSLTGGSPNAFSLSASELGAPGFPALYEYPGSEGSDSSSTDLFNAHQDSFLHLPQNGATQFLSNGNLNSQPPAQYGDLLFQANQCDLSSYGVTTLMHGEFNTTANYVPGRENKNRQESHRESERRRRESMKSSLATLESLVRARQVDVLDVESAARPRMSHSDIYRASAEIMETLKIEIAMVAEENRRLVTEISQHRYRSNTG